MIRHYALPSLMILFVIQGHALYRSCAQDAARRSADEELAIIYNKMHTALQGRTDATRLLEQAQEAWSRHRDLDVTAIANWPRDEKEKSDEREHETPKSWKEKMLKLRSLHLSQHFARLPSNQSSNERPPESDVGRANSEREFAKADQELNQQYARVIALLQDYKELKAKLLQSQLAWIKFRDLDVAFTAELARISKIPEQRPQQWVMTALTQERAGLLERMFTNFPESLKLTTRPPWPGVIRTIDFAKEFQSFDVSQLPEGVLKPSEVDFPAEKQMHILRIDLDKDGIAELIVCYGGGNGGMGYIIYHKKNNQYEKFGEVFGFTLSLLSMKNGFYQIGTSSKSGGGDYEKNLYQFQDGRYRHTRTDHFNEYRGYLGTQIISSGNIYG